MLSQRPGSTLHPRGVRSCRGACAARKRAVTRRPTAGACMQVLYEQYKRLFNGEYFGGSVRALSNPETIAIGALAGASASFITTPADVVKSRLMTAAAGSSTSTATIIVDLISKEGVWALFKACPRPAHLQCQLPPACESATVMGWRWDGRSVCA